MAIELLQIFTYRLADIDDLLSHTIRTIIGFITARAFIERFYANKRDICKFEPFVIMGTVFLIMFTVQPLISGMIWRYILKIILWKIIG
ncbi:hypothetical protein IMSAG049_01245 [Clostridiales bacterium]|nr:hypothetical protein IMSAG049_01245 [Clostridiales bacterium]